MTKITKRNIYTALINFANTGVLTYDTEDGEMTLDATDLATFAENEIALLDKKAVKAKEYSAKKKAEADELKDAIAAVLTDEPQTTADIVAQIEGEDITVAKVSYRLTALVKDGKAVKEQITIPATETSKARKVMAYHIA